MFKNYRPYTQDAEAFREWLTPDHLAFFISRIVDGVDLSAIYKVYHREIPVGHPPYHPLMMTKLWVYAYCDGVRSSRRVEKNTYENAPYRFLSGSQHPDHTSLSMFRKRHLAALAGIFEEVLRLAQEAGLVPLEHVAVDGSKVLANASKHKAMSYDRAVKFLKTLLPRKMDKLRTEIADLGPAESDDPVNAAQRDKLQKLLARKEEEKKRLLEWWAASKNEPEWRQS
jgi:transposase